MKTKNVVFLSLTAFIWGVAFVAQSVGGDVMGPFTFNAIRSLMGSVVLIPVIKVLDKVNDNKYKPDTKEKKKTLLKAGLICGVALCFATNLQQVGINMGTGAGKAGFITGCYILLVPVFSIFLGKRAMWNVWLAVLLGLAGLYMLCISEEFSLQNSDALVLLCSVCFTFQILTVEKYSNLVDGVRLSSIQFFITGMVSLIPMCIIEIPAAGGIHEWLMQLVGWNAWIPLLYSGILSCGVAYTFQILGQKGADATIASLIMSFEAVFSVLAGMIILHEVMSTNEIAGCVLLFVAIIIAQLKFSNNK